MKTEMSVLFMCVIFLRSVILMWWLKWYLFRSLKQIITLMDTTETSTLYGQEGPLWFPSPGRSLVGRL